MKNKENKNLTFKRLSFTIVGIIVAGVLLLLLFDNIIMPAYTHHDEGLTVPNVSQISLEKAKKELTSHGLRYEIADRRSNDAYPNNYIIDQVPSPSSIVKPNRKVYLTVNSETQTTVEVPQLVNLSFRNARIQIKNVGLKVGTVSYESSRFKNSVLEQSIEALTIVPKGTAIDLTISDGLGGKLVDVPELKGLRLSKAQRKILDKGLQVSEIEFKPSREVPPNTVLDFSPDEDQLLEGESIKLIISEKFGQQEETETGASVDTTNQTLN